MNDENDFKRFVFDGSISSLARDLERAQTPEDWGSVLVLAIDELAAWHYSRPRHNDTQETKWAWEVAHAKLRQLVRRGFRPPPHRPAQVFRADNDAYAILRWGKCTTQAEAVQFLRSVYNLPENVARSRVRLAMKAGLKLGRGRPFGRKPPPL